MCLCGTDGGTRIRTVRKARQVGDLITVQVIEQSSASTEQVSASTQQTSASAQEIRRR